ncbi:MAG: DUF4331 family protein [Candidatus Eisenbacteria bacterium]|nr:DUF4331 family protein [Candidatus Eisenbacteria bacterium]MCC7143681.1 DUF4331 family protein [Candidatus Eisenbacteria bacterium]
MQIRNWNRAGQIGLAALAAVAALGTIGVTNQVAWGSSHREAPLVSNDPLADNTDTYAFVSPDAPNTVTIVANYIPLEAPAGGPNFNKFGDDVLYEIHIDNNGDAKSDIDYQFSFKTTVQNPNTFLYNTGPITSLNDSDWNIRQTYSVRQVKNGNFVSGLAQTVPTPPVNIGPSSTPNYESLAEQAITTLPNGIKLFAGQRDDPFYVDLGGIFDLLTIRVLPGNNGGGIDGVAGFNTHTIAMQIPTQLLTKDGQLPTDPSDPDATIGVWATASRKRISILNPNGAPPSTGGPMVQVSRLGMPLVNEVVIPLGNKDRWNNSQPQHDGQFLSYVTDPELAVLLNLIYGLNVPLHGRDDLVAVFLTGVPGLNQPPNVTPSEQIRLNTAIPATSRDAESFSRMGVLGGNLDGFPNGRRLEDDVTDIEIQAVAGVTYKLFHPDWVLDPLADKLGDGVDQNDLPFKSSFPYLASPHQGFEDVLHSRATAPRPATTMSLSLQNGSLVVASNDPSSQSALGSILPASLSLGQNAPNPFQAQTRIGYALPAKGAVSVDVIDVTGRSVRTLVNGEQAAGSYEVMWDGADDNGNRMPSGTYFCRVSTDQNVESRKMTLRR